MKGSYQPYYDCFIIIIENLAGFKNGRSEVAYQKPLSSDIIIVFLKLIIMGNWIYLINKQVKITHICVSYTWWYFLSTKLKILLTLMKFHFYSWEWITMSISPLLFFYTVWTLSSCRATSVCSFLSLMYDSKLVSVLCPVWAMIRWTGTPLCINIVENVRRPVCDEQIE